jgi:ArsR family transcriptional regulator
MKDKTIYYLQANICKAMAHPLRMEVIDRLKEGECSFGELCEAVGSGKSNLSQHLASMVDKGVLVQRKEGLNVYYRLSSARVAAASDAVKAVLVGRLERDRALLMEM